MYIQVVLNSLYWGHVSYAYLSALSNAKKNGWAIITNEEYIKSSLNYEPLFFEVFDDVCVVTEEDRVRIPQLGITGEFYDRKEQEQGSRTKALMDLVSKRDVVFEEYVENFLDGLRKFNEAEIEGFIVFSEGYESIRYLAQKYNYVIINWEFSTFRKVNSFPINLMFRSIGGKLYGTNEAEKRYYKFIDECTDIPFFTRKELIALVGKKSTMHLIPLLEYKKYKYELGICETAEKVIPQTFFREQYTDDDVLYRALRTFSENEIVIREHPAFAVGSLRKMVSTHKEPIEFILSCKRIVAMASNVLLETMLWNRVSCTECNSLSYSFACEREFSSEELVEDKLLNFLIIAYFVPKQKYLFNPEYLRWRRDNTSEKSVYLKHLDIILSELGLDSEILELDEEKRFIKILEARGFTPYEIEIFSKNVSEKEVDFNAVSSFLECKDDKGEVKKSIYCLNEVENGEIVSKFVIENNYSDLDFYPYYDMAGLIKINQIIVNDDILTDKDECFYLIEPFWKKRIVCHLKKATNTIVIRWEYQELNVLNIKNDIQYYRENAEKYHQQIEQTYNSMSWKVTKPLRMAGGLVNRSIQLSKVKRYSNFSGRLVDIFRNSNDSIWRRDHHRKCKRYMGIENLADVSCILDITLNMNYKGIVVYPHAVHWEPIQRPQHILRAFAELGYLCFFCESYSNDKVIHRVQDNLFIVYGEERLLPVLKDKCPIVLCTFHNQSVFLDYLPSKIVWFDILDELDFFAGGGEKYSKKIYAKLISEAKIVTYSADNLKKYAENRKDAIKVNNGVCLADFSKKKQLKAIPEMEAIKNKGHIIIGYYGAIESWFDVNVIDVLLAKTDCEIVLIGKCGIDLQRIESERVHILGQVPYANLKNYASYFDIALIPFVVNKLTNSVSPVKFFEYAAQEIPVISSDIHEMTQYQSEFVKIYHNYEELPILVGEIINNKNDKSSLRSIAEVNSWDGIVNNIITFLG